MGIPFLDFRSFFLWVFPFFMVSGAQAQFLDFSQPARARALGGNLVALPEGPSAMAFNPAGLAFQQRFEVSTRYESLFSGLEGDSLATGNISFLSPSGLLGPIGALGGSWDHSGSSLFQQDRFKLAWGKSMEVGGLISQVAGGLCLSSLDQRYTLTTPLQGVSVNQLSSSAFSFGAGLLVSVGRQLTLGVSAEDINQPNLGVVGTDAQPVLLRWGLSYLPIDQGSVQLALVAGQSLVEDRLEVQGGAECSLKDYGIKLRAGGDSNEASVGLGYEISDLFLDYAYSFSLFGSPDVSNASLPGSHFVELGLKWGAPPAPDSFAGYAQKAAACERSGHWDQACFYYQVALALKPGDGPSQEGYQRALTGLNGQKAEKYFQDGQAALKQGFVLEAQHDFKSAADLQPQDSRYTKALETAKDTAPNTPKNVPSPQEVQRAQLVSTEVDLYLSKGRPDLARKELEEALKDQPQNPVLLAKWKGLGATQTTLPRAEAQKADQLYDQGLQSYMDGDLDGAIRLWEKALQVNPHHTRAQNNLVRAMAEKESQKQ